MVLIERQGECYVDVVCDACAIIWALQHTSAQTVSPRCHGVIRGGILELPGDWVLQSTAGLWLKRTFGCVFATPNFQHFLHLTAQWT